MIGKLMEQSAKEAQPKFLPGIQLLTEDEELIATESSFETTQRLTPMGYLNADLQSLDYVRKAYGDITSEYRYIVGKDGLLQISGRYDGIENTYFFILNLDTLGRAFDVDCALTLPDETSLTSSLTIDEDLEEKYSGITWEWKQIGDAYGGLLALNAGSKEELEALVRTLRFNFGQHIPKE